jgi:thiamine kinase-like enzyme
MSNFKVRYWDDNPVIIQRIKSSCLDLNRKYGNIDYQSVEYATILESDKSFLDGIDLFIFDLLDETKSKALIGLEILESFKNLEVNTPVIVYTTGTQSGGNSLDLHSYEEKYPNAVFIKKSEDADTRRLKAEIEKIIQKNLDEQFEVGSDYIEEFNQQLYYFGKPSINQILFQVKQLYGIKEQKVKLFKLKSGFSGAILFKFNFNNTEYVLKLSKDVPLLKSELDKAKSYYPLFPSKFFNYIDPKEFYTGSNDTMAIVIKLIPHTKTLFDYIRQLTSQQNVENILNEVYNNFGLKQHYKTQTKDNLPWTDIFKKFKNSRFITISEVHKELKPLLIDFNLSEVQNLIEKEDYKQLNAIKISHRGTVTLNHLDLHSKNILVQGENTPFLIDTGIMDYDYWCFDICRLLVDLFINGIDIDKKEFYDINLISKNVELGRSFIKLNSIAYDSKNDRAIDAINWLTANVSNIYEDYFTLWELQLGLMKEFLQMSYRTSIPHSKRALALELAYVCMIEAEKNASC